MKIILSSFLIIITFSVHAQLKLGNDFSGNFSKKPVFNNFNNRIPSFNTQQQLFKLPANSSAKSIQATDDMILKLPETKLTYLDNSDHFNIYQANTDNMFVLKPDSSIAFTMPIKTLSEIETANN